jgi:predicted transcriptional regulator of viral defense system
VVKVRECQSAEEVQAMKIRERLWEVAVDQLGFVTSKDAKRLGIPVIELGKLAYRGQLERHGYGIYRFPQMPVSEFDRYMLATLWADARGVLSHDTALALYGLCDVNPNRIHVTVPKRFYPRAKDEEQYVVHHADLATDDIGWFEHIRAVKPRIAVRQAVEGAVPAYLARQAVETARRRGFITAGEADELQARLGSAAE